jgi:hypothetical protein
VNGMLLSFLIKNWKYLAALVLISASWYGITSHYEQKGYQRAVDELQVAQNRVIKEATDKAVAQAELKVKKALKFQQEIHARELERSRKERETKARIEKVTEYVDKIVIRNECSDVGTDIKRVLNESIRAANEASSER